MKIGYARVSTEDQNLDLQIELLQKENCELIYSEKKSGKNNDREEFHAMFKNVREGDVIIVYRMDRIVRSVKGMVELMDMLDKKKCSIKSITESFFDTTNPQGKMIMTILCSVAEWERDVIVSRTSAGQRRAREEGRLPGRVKGTILDKTVAKMEVIGAFMNEGRTQYWIAKHMGVGTGAISKIVKKMKEIDFKKD